MIRHDTPRALRILEKLSELLVLYPAGRAFVSITQSHSGGLARSVGRGLDLFSLYGSVFYDPGCVMEVQQGVLVLGE